MRDLETHLYGEDGRFLFVGKKVGLCMLCRDKGYTFDVGAMGPASRFCKRCILKVGAANLRRDANHALQAATKKIEMVESAWNEMQSRYRAKFGVPLKLHREGMK